MKPRTKMLLSLPVLLIMAVIVFALFFKKVPVATTGVRQSRWTEGGIEAQDYETGYQLGISGVHLWHFLPKRTHFVHFIGDGHGLASRGGLEDRQPALEIRTKDNNIVSVDVSIPYRIIKGSAHEIVQNRLTLTYPERVKSTVESVLRAELSELTSEDLQITMERLKRAESTLPVLNQELAKFHVVADRILLRQVRFTAEYEAKLQEKQFLRQKAKLDQALTAQNNMEKEVNEEEKKIDAEILKDTREWEQKFQVERSNNDVAIATIRAEAQVYQQRTRAEGDAEGTIARAQGQLRVELAAALRDELRNAALASRGGSIKLALEAVENLNVESVVLNSNDPAVPMFLDLGEMTELLVGPRVPTAAESTAQKR